MNINTGLNPYNNSFVNNVEHSKMSQSQSLTGSPTEMLKEGEIFEGSVNSIENGKVTIGLANGQTMTARLDAGVSLTPGQSVFFQVKSNDGLLLQIRPVSLNSLDANPTLLKALDMANIAANERTINMVNSMMQNSMSINPENLTAMNRAMLNNPDVDPQILVTMAKNNLDITPDNVTMFQNYAADKGALSSNFDTISEMLPELMSSNELSVSDAIHLNNQIREIFVLDSSQTEAATTEQAVSQEVTAELTAKASDSIDMKPMASEIQSGIDILSNDAQVTDAGSATSQVQDATGQSAESENINANPIVDQNADAIKTQDSSFNGAQVISNFAGENQIHSFNTLLNSLPDFPKDNLEIFSENGILKSDANIKEVFREISDYFNEHPDIPKETFNDIIKTPLYKGLLKNIISDSFSLEPKDITKPGEISKLYERVLKQTEALEKLIANFNTKTADTIKSQTTEIRQNINFMNSANEMYNFLQIPLKMYNQNTDSMLYVRQNKKSSYEAGEEITAFLHFDMEYLGSTDIYISLKETKVGCKWNLESEESLQLIDDNIDILTKRLADKGFYMTSEMTCGQPKSDFVEDFFGTPVSTENKPEGIVHRYSFDMRA